METILFTEEEYAAVMRKRDDLEQILADYQKQNDTQYHALTEARAQLGSALTRIAVLETALREVAIWPLDGRGSLVDRIQNAKRKLVEIDPLAAAVERVVAAAMRQAVMGSHHVTMDQVRAQGRNYHEAATSTDTAVDALRALAPWWPTD